ncbi:mandelate racemase/muconate lactonizing enzyme family protein [Roseixanthobacter glucoisosaccharinicivorans]|uniref:mandelate racemase/muconate lactonizing enzyme family protein n=1 Tax=Roseixanthobacter glucoisosaccharinicivorans TaxID=3119923 RepID=UPI00372CE01B
MATIDKIVTHHVSIPFERPLQTGNHVYRDLENVLIEIHAGGLVGIGYAFNFAFRQAAAIRLIVEDLAQPLVGKTIADRHAHTLAMWRQLNFIGQTGPSAMAMSVVDTALWDLFAQSLATPLHRLLGSVRSEIELYPTGGFLADPIEAVIEEVERHRAAGFRRCKIKVGRPDWQIDVARVGKLRAAVGDDFGIMIDANQAWSVADAIAAGRRFQDLGVCWYEEPVSVYDVAGTARVADALDMPVAAGESVFTRYGHLELLDGKACDVLMPNLMRCGGPTEFMEVGALAAARHVPVSAHTFTEISAHLVAAMPNATFCEYLPGWWEKLFNEEQNIVDGMFHLPDRPGLGLSFSREIIERYGSHG